jgi:hypothetical protein
MGCSLLHSVDLRAVIVSPAPAPKAPDSFAVATHALLPPHALHKKRRRSLAATHS